MAGMASILFGSLSLAARSWDGGEAKAGQVSDMRADADVSARPDLRAVSAADVEGGRAAAAVRGGAATRCATPRCCPSASRAGGVYYFRLAVVRTGEKSQLVQERIVPDLAALQEPEFRDAERSVLADGIAELTIGYFGRDAERRRRRRADVARSLGGPAAAAAAGAPRREARQGRRLADARRRAAALAGGGLPGLGPRPEPLREGGPMSIPRRRAVAPRSAASP